MYFDWFSAINETAIIIDATVTARNISIFLLIKTETFVTLIRENKDELSRNGIL
jgi:hypothetical protein